MTTFPTDANVGRVCKLVVSTGTEGLDLSEFRINFHIKAADIQTPNMAYIRIYNLAPSTRANIVQTCRSVLLQAGYVNNYGGIFQGNIIRFKQGKESNVDSYLDIITADGDEGYNFGVISQSFAAGSDTLDHVTAIAAQMGINVGQSVKDILNNPMGSTGGIQPRGTVLYGLGKSLLADIARDYNARWSIQNGTLVMVLNTGYLPGTALVINSNTGMIGIPEATDNGVQVQIELNPLVKIGGLVQLNQDSISNYPNMSAGFLNNSTLVRGTTPFYSATVTTDGFYRVMSVEHEGDTRGGQSSPWSSSLICLAVDQTAPVVSSVQAS